MQQHTSVIYIKLGYTVPFILNSWDKIHKMEALWEGYPCLSSKASCKLLNSFLLNTTLKNKFNFCPCKENRSLLSSCRSLINSLKNVSCTRAPLDPVLPGLHLMGFKEPCTTVPQNLVWDAKHSGIFQVLKIQHVWQCIQTFWISHSRREHLKE